MVFMGEWVEKSADAPAPLDFFDLNIVLGKRAVCYPGSYFETEKILQKMDQYGIGRALVYHSMARLSDPAEGNRVLMDCIAGQERLFPVFVGLPHHTCPAFAPKVFFETLKENRVCGVKLFPSVEEHNFMLNRLVSGELLDLLAQNNIPLLVGHNQFSNCPLEELAALMREFPRLRVILTDFTYRQDRNLYALMEQHPSLYIETIGYKTFGGIEAFCSRFGADRLLFGSGMPFYSGASGVAMISYADIPRPQQEAIAYRNLEGLLAEVSYLPAFGGKKEGASHV